MSSSKIEQDLHQAKQLVQEKKYKEAYRLLKQIPDPKAERWLGELLKRFPELEQEEDKQLHGLFEDVDYDTFIAESETVPQEVYEDKPKNDEILQEAWNPLVCLLTFPFSSCFLSLNWGRLGRRGWAIGWTTLSLLLLAGSIGLSFFMLNLWGNRYWVVNQQSWELRAVFYGWASLIGLYFAITPAFVLAQYKSWQVSRRSSSIAEIKRHQKLSPILPTMLIFTLLIVGLLHYFLGYTAWPRSIHADDVTLNFPAGWEVNECPEPEKPEISCLAYISIHNGSEYNWVTVTLITYEMEEGQNIFDVEAASHERYVESYPDSGTVHTEAPLVDERRYLVIRDDMESYEECANKWRHVYTDYDGRVYQLNIVASCQRLWERFSSDIEMISRSLEFK